MVKILVETVSMMRMRYVVEVPNNRADYALDTVACDEATEMSQQHLGETIVSSREISDKEYFKMFDEDNQYMSSWSDEEKLRFVTVVRGVSDE